MSRRGNDGLSTSDTIVDETADIPLETEAVSWRHPYANCAMRKNTLLPVCHHTDILRRRAVVRAAPKNSVQYRRIERLIS